MGTSQDEKKSQHTFCSVILSSAIGQSFFFNDCIALFAYSYTMYVYVCVSVQMYAHVNVCCALQVKGISHY